MKKPTVLVGFFAFGNLKLNALFLAQNVSFRICRSKRMENNSVAWTVNQLWIIIKFYRETD